MINGFWRTIAWLAIAAALLLLLAGYLMGKVGVCG